MNCLLHLLAICVFDPSNVYVSSSIDFANDNVHINERLNGYEGSWCSGHWCRGPIGTFEIGHSAELSRGIIFSYQIKHVSFIEEDDRGFESFGVSLIWKPFSR